MDEIRAPDDVLGGRYQLVRTVGRGGMATVHEARDRVLDRTVAVKVLAAGLAVDQLFLARFRREARAAARLTHPNIVAVYDSGADAGRHYIVMEFVDAGSLADHLRARSHLTVAQALTIAGDVLAGLGVAHAAGLIHRDITPGNVMLTAGGQAKLGDFGVARVMDDVTGSQTAGLFGTAAYMSPEQARGDDVSATTDLYSVGCVLFAMLTGRPPFVADNPVAVAVKHEEDPPPVPSSLRAGIPAAVDAVVLRSLVKRPDERFASADAMRAAVGIARADAGSRMTGPAPILLSRPAPTTRKLSVPGARADDTAATAPVDSEPAIEPGVPRRIRMETGRLAQAPAPRRSGRLRMAIVGASAAALATGILLVALPGGNATSQTNATPRSDASAPASPTAGASPSRPAPAVTPATDKAPGRGGRGGNVHEPKGKGKAKGGKGKGH